MKKNYNQPQTEIVSVELANMIMSVSGSTGPGLNIGDSINDGVGG